MKKQFKTIAISEHDSQSLNFLYKNRLGRFFLKLMIQPAVSKLAGVYLNSIFSKGMIQRFIKKNQIVMEEYQAANYSSFNQFFMREIKATTRPFPAEVKQVAAPCDGKVTAYPIDSNSVFTIKHSVYNVSELLEDSKLGEEWLGGVAVILRLTPDDYHHYHFIDGGRILTYKKIPGLFHTVRPIAIHNELVFSRNTREVTIIETNHFGKIAQIEVGALMVGKIENVKESGACQRFEKKGWFEFGGSTVILLFQKGQVMIASEILGNTMNQQETIVKLGEVIGVGGEKNE